MNEEQRKDLAVDSVGIICLFILTGGVAMLSWPWAFIVFGSLGFVGSVIGAVRR